MSQEKKVMWFEEWFDTSYYHTLYKHRDEKEAELFISALLDELKVPSGTKCLDLACGKGRHALYLNKKGLDVVGLDLSENSISKAKELEKKGLHFDVHDMREVYKDNEFDVVFNLFTSFGYFDSSKDNLRVLTAVHRMLRPGGKLVLDFMNVPVVLKNLVPKETKEIDGITFDISREFDGTHIFKYIGVLDNNTRTDFQERVQALFLEDFENLLKQSGFEIAKLFGNFMLNPFDINSSRRLIIIANKI
ncbi:MAG: class I SAM-dependent methyltransferase [Brumimicrobium sp.]|nr:class I SAM-dependent methyltransferase [Brumimicrobium sp.]